ncbi:hypothetical protein P154DRAFT_523584 [Amniculicola lignicola CBS 123094]|uniref:Lysine-specific metallo-endopeptidase domain-containing protein n=1 Tax=Amniculicola lignicola CBS 123094 TaxID=1392246 RepID=A0A6A5WBZ1_9PLEO|nr:hypothetical protein P154DRAFT_523584 [Amniculicola lignicola CBS 123094]
MDRCISALFRFILLLFLSHSQFIAAYPERRVWIDQQGCGDDVRSIWSVINGMRTTGSLATLEDSGAGKQIFDLIFKERTYASHIDDTLEAINEVLFDDRTQANTRIYCDQESRWHKATNAEVPGNENRPEDKKAWFDTENSIVYDPKDDKYLVPGCHKDLNNFVLGQTYCGAKDGSDTCTITLCAKSLPQGNFRYYSLAQLKERGIDFSGTGPQRIDMFALLDTTILHELAHTIDHPNTRSGKWIDYGDAYRWRNIRPMNAAGAMANADSLAYLGLGSYIQDSLGRYIINDDGSIGNR